MEEGTDVGARSALLLAAHLAGLAFSTTGLGTAHAIGHALSAHYGTPHGVALAAVLPIVTADNLPHREEETTRLAYALGVPDAAAVPGAVAELQDRIGLRPTLADLGVAREDLPALEEAALADVVIRNAPRTHSHAELVRRWRTRIADARAGRQIAASSSGVMPSRPSVVTVRLPSARKSRASTTEATAMTESMTGVGTPTRVARSVRKTSE